MLQSAYNSLIVFLTGILGIWKAIPVGLLLKLNPPMIFFMTASGAIVGVSLLYFFGNRIRIYISNRRTKKGKTGKERKAAHLLEKYGVPGLGFFGCLIMGPNMTIILGLILVKSRKQLYWWTVAGIIAWSLVLTIIASLSLEVFIKLTEPLKF
ncbi:MAG: small multi-drug export protein [Bacteroidales bacterium]|nr:small multi-drug export protein [Bacteroidales bacterium]